MTNYVQPTSTQKYQIGQESSYGAGTTAGKSLQSINFTPKPEFTAAVFKSNGHRFTTEVVPNLQWTSAAFQSQALYTEILYLLEAMFGTVAATTVGTSTKKRVYTPKLQDAHTPKSIVTQWGDTNNVYQYGYGLVPDLSIKSTRKDGVTASGNLIAQIQASGGSFTASPTVMANQPIAGTHINYYLDTTGAGIGTTQQTLSINDTSMDIKGLYGVYWDSDRAQTSFATHVDLVPTATYKINFNENANTRSLDASMSIGSTYFFRLDCQGPLTETGQHYLFQVDAALKLTNKDAYGDNDGVLGRVFTFEIVEDSTWGKALVFTSQTLETSL